MSSLAVTKAPAGPAAQSIKVRGPRVSLADLGWLPIWILTRIYVLAQHMTRERHIVGDVNYYFAKAGDALAGQEALVEYPAPVVWLLTGLRVISGDDVDRYRLLFVCLMAALDLLVAALLWTRYSRLGAVYWIVFLALVGSLMWYRIDLLAAVPMLLALLWFGPARWTQGWFEEVQIKRAGHPTFAGGAVAVGAAMKLWPALLIFPLLGTSARGKSRGLGFLIAGGAIGLSSLLFAGWSRSISPLTWQSDRGLHCESIWATVPMWRRMFGSQSGDYRVEFSNYNAYEVYGPGVDRLTQWADHSMLAVLALALLFGWLIALGGVGLPGHSRQNAELKDGDSQHWHAAVLAVVALMLATLVANKTFSPQYLIWFAGPLAVMVTLRGGRLQQAAQILIAGLGLIIAGLTRWIYPLHYGEIIGAPTEQATRILVLRNVLVIIAVVVSVILAIVAAWQVGLAKDAAEPVDSADFDLDIEDEIVPEEPSESSKNDRLDRGKLTDLRQKSAARQAPSRRA